MSKKTKTDIKADKLMAEHAKLAMSIALTATRVLALQRDQALEIDRLMEIEDELHILEMEANGQGLN